MHTAFNFSLGQLVKLERSQEEGEVIARSEYLTSEPCYLVRYQAADGRQVEAWWGESAVKAD